MKPPLYIIYVCAVCAVCGACGPEAPAWGSLAERQPRIVSIVPEDGADVEGTAEVVLEFSRPMNTASIDSRTLAVARVTEDRPLSGLSADIAEGNDRGVEGEYIFEEGNTRVRFRASEIYEAGAAYAVIATRYIMSEDMLPLSRNGSSAAFVSTFTAVGPAGGADISGGENGTDPGARSGGISEAFRERPAWLVINEVLYDAAGSDTDGDVFIELAGEAGGDIGGYKVVLVGGGDGKIADTIKIEEGDVQDDGIFLIADAKTGESTISDVTDADLIANFDPQNGPDCVQLLDDKGALVDAVGYGSPLVETASNGLVCYEGKPAPKTSSGKSLSRTDFKDTDDNSADFAILDAPTPGAQ